MLRWRRDQQPALCQKPSFNGDVGRNRCLPGAEEPESRWLLTTAYTRLRDKFLADGNGPLRHGRVCATRPAGISTPRGLVERAESLSDQASRQFEGIGFAVECGELPV